jgi:hypothetical protein
MRSDQFESTTPVVLDAVVSIRDSQARGVARGLIQSHIGPDNKVIDMPSFNTALVRALKDARMQGQDDCGVLTLT